MVPDRPVEDGAERRVRRRARRHVTKLEERRVTELQQRRLCKWCGGELSTRARSDTIYCSRKCRQAAFRVRKLQETELRYAQPMTMAYADPPYPGKAGIYKDQPDYKGEVDQVELIASLVDRFDGWALSTSEDSLRFILPLCPPEAHVCPWVKPIGVSRATNGMHNAWEPLIVVPGRELQPGFRDWLSAQPARHGGTLPGRKPIAFCVFLFRCLGLCRGDTLVDLYPGSGIVSQTWAEVSFTPA
jgi:hypothetical protein